MRGNEDRGGGKVEEMGRISGVKRGKCWKKGGRNIGKGKGKCHLRAHLNESVNFLSDGCLGLSLRNALLRFCDSIFEDSNGSAHPSRERTAGDQKGHLAVDPGDQVPVKGLFWGR